MLSRRSPRQLPSPESQPGRLTAHGPSCAADQRQTPCVWEVLARDLLDRAKATCHCQRGRRHGAIHPGPQGNAGGGDSAWATASLLLPEHPYSHGHRLSQVPTCRRRSWDFLASTVPRASPYNLRCHCLYPIAASSRENRSCSDRQPFQRRPARWDPSPLTTLLLATSRAFLRERRWPSLVVAEGPQ